MLTCRHVSCNIDHIDITSVWNGLFAHRFFVSFLERDSPSFPHLSYRWPTIRFNANSSRFDQFHFSISEIRKICHRTVGSDLADCQVAAKSSRVHETSNAQRISITKLFKWITEVRCSTKQLVRSVLRRRLVNLNTCTIFRSPWVVSILLD